MESATANAIIDEEGMGNRSIGSVCCLVMSDDGYLTDGSAWEKADLSSEENFRAQVRKWREDISQ